MTLLALDFDGVLCDSAREMGISAWKALAMIRTERSSPLPPDGLLAAYELARPIIETGHEAVLVMKLLNEGIALSDLLGDFPGCQARLMAEMGWDHEGLRRSFGAARDRWIEADADQWSSLSPFFPGVGAFLRKLTVAPLDTYIITTKQERFVRRLLDYNDIDFPSERIFGLERGVPKENILLDLLTRYPDRRLCFVEDRLATLVRVMGKPELVAVRLYLADWGYNTDSDRESARELKIPVLDPCDFLEFTFLEDNK
uniref:Phosphoglycolate phosphatase, HAD superfamily n=1 Tax=Candidatus Kentrum sp. SD TaxID=2126332 RepID=A0A451BJN9_9GAMM|nr:MAG: Phosphoglycolate phosphatase, HAD superfamily [Candidatus Kentron sp. SD]